VLPAEAVARERKDKVVHEPRVQDAEQDKLGHLVDGLDVGHRLRGLLRWGS